MNNKLIIVASGKKGSGKNTLANQIAACFLNFKFRNRDYHYQVGSKGQLQINHHGGDVEDTSIEHGVVSDAATQALGVRLVAFAAPLKDFCIHVMGLHHEQCYGTDAEKNTKTHVWWDSLPLRIRWKYAKYRWYNPLSWLNARTGPMTGREVLQVFGTDIMRTWQHNIWAKAGMQLAMKRPEQLVLMTDCRFPNEVEAAKDADDMYGPTVKTVRLLRAPFKGDTHPSETALDHHPQDRYDLVVPDGLSIEQQWEYVSHPVVNWMENDGLLPLSR